ncbi:uncharacterized protein [Macaca nemestrina]|uniref:uncharacterized protein n=1 Tax=Macaca nemestrina TaxID=9545 RepID=UPI0039B9B8DF
MAQAAPIRCIHLQPSVGSLWCLHTISRSSIEQVVAVRLVDIWWLASVTSMLLLRGLEQQPQQQDSSLIQLCSRISVPRACLQTAEPRTPRPPHRPGPECAGPDLQPPRILTPLHRSACVGVLSPRHPSRNQEERERRAFPHPPPCAPGWRSLLQQLGLEFGLRKGLHPRRAHAMNVGAGRVSTLSSPGSRLFPGAAQEAGLSAKPAPVLVPASALSLRA